MQNYNERYFNSTADVDYRLLQKEKRPRSRSRSPFRNQRSWDDKDNAFPGLERNSRLDPKLGSKLSTVADSNTVIVKGIPLNMSENELFRTVETQGFDPKDVRILRNKDTGSSRGFAFVEFADSKDAAAWIEFNKGQLSIDSRHTAELQFSLTKPESAAFQSSRPATTVSPWLSGAPPFSVATARPAQVGSTASSASSAYQAATVSGDWLCSRCCTSNFKQRDNCFKCGITRQESEWNSTSMNGFSESSTTPCDTLLLRNLPPSVGETRLQNNLRQLTTLDIVRIILATDQQTGASQGFAFVQMKNTMEASHLLTTLSTITKLAFDGKEAVVSYSKTSLPQLLTSSGQLINKVGVLISQDGQHGQTTDSFSYMPETSSAVDAVNVAAAVAHNALLKAQAAKQIHQVIINEQLATANQQNLLKAAQAATVLISQKPATLQLHQLLANHAANQLQEQMAVAQLQAQAHQQAAALQAAVLQQAVAANPMNMNPLLMQSGLPLSLPLMHGFNIPPPRLPAFIGQRSVNPSVQAQAFSAASSAVASAFGNTPTFAAAAVPINSSRTGASISEAPDPTKFKLDSAGSGYYLDSRTGFLYDPKTQYYYNPQSQKWQYWDSATQAYVAIEQPEVSVSSAAETGAVSKEKEKQEKAKAAKDIQREMEKWAKSQGKRKKETATSSAAKNPATPSEVSASSTSYTSIFDPSSGDGRPVGIEAVQSSSKLNAIVAYERDADSDEEAAGTSVAVASTSGSAHDGDFERLKLQVEEEVRSEVAAMINWEKPSCLLCKRGMSSKETLTKHVQMSDLHKQNVEQLLNARLTERSLEEAKSLEQQQQTEHSSTVQQSPMQYRDRAKERREKFGSDEKVVTVSANKSKRNYEEAKSSSFVQPNVHGIAADNIGSKLLKSMGWKEGQGLGRSNQGIVEPIKAEQRMAGVGLGNSASVVAAGANYQESAKTVLHRRFYNQD